MPARRMVVFFTVALSIWTGLNAYVFWRISTLPPLAHVSRFVFTIIAVFLWSSYVLGRLLSSRRMDRLAAPLEWIGSHWLGFIFLIFIALLFSDIVTGFGYLLPQLTPTVRSYAVLAALTLSLFAMLQALRAPVITSYDVSLSGLPASLDGTVVAVASDLHVGETVGANWLSGRVAQIQALRPHLIILAGDIVEGEAHDDALLPVFRRLSAPMGVFAVTGNHEFYSGVESRVKFLEAAGVQVLRDRWTHLCLGLVLAGVDDLTARRQYGEDSDFVNHALAGRPSPAATLFVSHTPWQVEKAQDAGVGLMLSGHTHDGQIWPFVYLVKTQYRFVSGRYDLGNMQLIVCRGSGTWGPRMRLWPRSEILRITLHS